MIKTLIDGTQVELAAGDAYSGPGDCFGPLHVNTTAVFYRINEGIWTHCNCHMHQARQLLNMCNCVEDVQYVFESIK